MFLNHWTLHCIHLCNKGFVDCNLTIISPLCWWTVLADSLIMFCIDMLNEEELLLWFSSHIAQMEEHHDSIDLNADVTLVTVHLRKTSQLSSLFDWSHLFLTELSFKFTYVILSCHLDTKWESPGPAQHFYTCLRAGLDVWKHQHSLCSTVLSRGVCSNWLSFLFSPVHRSISPISPQPALNFHYRSQCHPRTS